MKTKRTAGFSLVETMVSVVVLAVLALGGAATLYHTGGNIQQQQNQREAVIAVTQAMEAVWRSATRSCRIWPTIPILKPQNSTAIR